MTQPIIPDKPRGMPALNCARTDDHPAHAWGGVPLPYRTPEFWCDPADPLADRRLSERAARMAQPSPDEPDHATVRTYVRIIRTHLAAGDSLDSYALGLIAGVAATTDQTDAELRQALTAVLAAVDLVRGEMRDSALTPDRPLERVRTTDGSYRVLDPKGVGTGSLTWDPCYGDYGIVVASGPLSTLFDPAIEAQKCCALMENCGEADMFAHLELLYLQLSVIGGR